MSTFTSSVIKSFRADQKLGLVIEFHSGKVYSYPDATKEVFIAFRDAESKGKFFNAHIKNQYKAVPVQ